MLSRYLGNKTELLPPILEAIGQHAPPGGRVGDLFAGTFAVPMALKAAGFDVVANDVNLFSTVYGRAFLAHSAVPEVDLGLLPRERREGCAEEARRRVQSVRGVEGWRFLEDGDLEEAYLRLMTLLVYLERVDLDSLPPGHRMTHFFDTYTEAGARSAYRSQRGTEGRRRFFSPHNGQRLDAALNQLRAWWRAGALSSALLDLCCAVICRAAERVGNNQGTWHDFPRDWTDPRALRPLVVDPPPMDAALAGGDHLVGDAEDSLQFVRRCPPMDVLYLDPPYNFRQYTSYYFLPNLLCRYPRLDDPDGWFEGVRYVRGQNMADDFASPFCRKRLFLEALGRLIGAARADTVVLSYFNGRNHWNDFKKDPNGEGLARLTRFFSGPLFVPGTLDVRPIPRKNYQSYRGYKGRRVDEYLFVVRRAPGAVVDPDPGGEGQDPRDGGRLSIGAP